MSDDLSFPTLSEILDELDGPLNPDSALSRALATLFEPSPILLSEVVPALPQELTEPTTRPSSLTYYSLIDLASHTLSSLTPSLQASFVGAHPRIGEVNGLSRLSASEQASRATPPKVLDRLAVLNAAYEHRYVGLRYITFVNGRSRKEIMEEMEEALGVGKEDIDLEAIDREEVGGELWQRELERAVEDVGKIAKSRLRALGVDGDATVQRV